MPVILLENLKWMGWNLFLASIPVIISFIIFRKKLWEKPSLLRIPLAFCIVIFYFFLPNSPYVITDIIHLVRQIKDYKYFRLSDNHIIVLLIPQFLLFIFIGFSFYVIAFQKMIHLLLEFKWKIAIIWIIKIINPLIMSIGIFLGRFYRFNSWDIISNSEQIILSTIKEFSNFYFIVFVLINSILIFCGFEILSLFYKSLFRNLFIINNNEN